MCTSCRSNTTGLEPEHPRRDLETDLSLAVPLPLLAVM